MGLHIIYRYIIYMSETYTYMHIIYMIESSICGATVCIAFGELLDVLGVLLQRLDEPREGGRHVREVRDAAADDQELAIRVLVPLF